MFGTVSVLSVLTSGILAGGVLWALSSGFRPKHSGNGGAIARRYLIRDGVLVDCDNTEFPAFRSLRWSQLKQDIEQRFSVSLSQVGLGEQRQCFPAQAVDDKAILIVERVEDAQRLTIWELGHAAGQADAPSCAIDTIFQQAMADAPEAVFAFDAAGKLCWKNEAFAALAMSVQDVLLEHTTRHKSSTKIDISIQDEERGRARYFEVTLSFVGQHSVAYAADVSRLVEADNVRNAFVQTLTKTFADLTIGLAVFDRDRQLVLFNPAILDLTGLPAEFLISRPDLFEFFDHLRDRQVLPEPKDYAGWRAQISRMIESAADGHYVESWSLPNGVTYRLSGRPHPDGAVAFLIEDISDETALARRYNTQVELRQAVLDQLDEAIAVIGPDGLLAFCNDRFSDVVGFDPDGQFSGLSLEEIVQGCQNRFPELPFWEGILSASPVMRFERSGATKEHQDLTCAYEGLPNGFSMLTLTWMGVKAPQDAGSRLQVYRLRVVSAYVRAFPFFYLCLS